MFSHLLFTSSLTEVLVAHPKKSPGLLWRLPFAGKPLLKLDRLLCRLGQKLNHDLPAHRDKFNSCFSKAAFAFT